MDIKEEFPISEVISQTERESFSQDVAMMLNSGATVCNKVCETEIKEERVDSDLSAQNDWPCSSKDLVTNVKQCHKYEMETKTELNEVCVGAEFCLPNERQFFFSEVPAVKFDLHSNDSELDSKIKIKEEMPWLERASTEDPCVDEVTKVWVDESFPSTESIRSYNEASRDKSSLFPNENFGCNATFNIIQDNIECETAIKYTSKKIVIPEISSVQKRVYSKQHDSEKIVSLKYTDFVQQNSIQVQQLNEKNCNDESDLLRNIIVRNYKCGICDKRYTSMSALNKHKLIHTGIKPHKCDTCGKCFTAKSDMKQHKLTHEGLKPHKCDTCGKWFTQLHTLKKHKLIHDGIKPHKCDTCGKSFTQLKTLKAHKLIHEGIKPHKCNTCGKCFTQFSTLKAHALIHEGLKPYKCDTCGKCFTQLSTLNAHKLIHEAIRPHKCDTCGKYVKSLRNLKAHKLTHKGIKPHKCDTCGTSFTQSNSLKMHKLIHEGIKQHKCDSCGICFTLLQNLKKHKLIHEGIKPHRCDTCGKCFTLKQTLKKHKLIHEGIKLQV